MGSYINYHYWTDTRLVVRYFESEGYETSTMLKFLKTEFGYSSGKEIKEAYGVKDSFLRVTLVYKEEEKFDLKRRVSDLLDYIKDADSKYWWKKNCGVIFQVDVYDNLSWSPAAKDDLVGYYEIGNRFKSLITEHIDKTMLNNEEKDRISYYNDDNKYKSSPNYLP